MLKDHYKFLKMLPIMQTLFKRDFIYQSWLHPLQSVDCCILQTSAADANLTGNWGVDHQKVCKLNS